MAGKDITLCINDLCSRIWCERNPVHAVPDRLHSYAWLEGTEYCIKNKEDERGDD